MYNYESSLTLKVRAGSIYETPNLKFEPVSSIYTNYYKVILVLSHPASPVPLYLDMADMRDQLAAFTGTVKEWLELNGLESLPTTEEQPALNLRYARYIELSRGGYEVFLGNEGLHYAVDVDRSMLFDVGVRRKDTDMKHVNDTSLLTINGFVHDTSADEETLYIRKGKVTAEKSRTYGAGLISFASIGKLTKHKLKAENIKAFEGDTPMSEKLRITVPEQADNKPFFLVMGGYIIFPHDGEFFRTEEKDFALCLEKLNYIERLLESSEFIDLSSLEMTDPNNMGGVGWFVEQANSDEVIRRYLTHQQSFLVTIDAPNLQVKRHVLKNEPYPGRFLMSQQPVDPVMSAHGRMLEYWPIQTKHGWVMDCIDNFKRNYVYTEAGPEGNRMVDPTPDPTNRHRLSGAYTLEIYSSL